MQQQHLLPASKGVYKSTPSSLIPDGGMQDVNNVRFGDGFVEKVMGFSKLGTFGSKVRHVVSVDVNDSDTYNIVHTSDNVYVVSNSSDITSNPAINPEEIYQVRDEEFVSSQVLFKKYLFTSLTQGIYELGTDGDWAKRLYGTFAPNDWEPSKAYAKGDLVAPTLDNYNGFIYKCKVAGTSGSAEPSWLAAADAALGDIVEDNTVTWEAIGGLEIIGNSAKNLKAKCLGGFKGFLFVANTQEDGYAYPTRLRWSQYQQPYLWHNNDDGSGMAGYVDCDDTPGEILTIRGLGDYLFIYKEDGIIALSYVGDDTIFSKEIITSEAGIMAPLAIVARPHVHYFVGKDYDVYSFDGSSVSKIGANIKEYLKDNVSPTGKKTIFGYYDELKEDVCFAFKSTADEDGDALNRDKAIIYNVNLKTWSIRDLNMSAVGEYTRVDNKVIDDLSDIVIDTSSEIIDSAYYKKGKKILAAGDAAGNFYTQESFVDIRGDYSGYVLSKTHHMEKPEKLKRLLRIMFHIQTQGNYNMFVQVGTGWNSESDMTWSKKYYMNLEGPKPPFIDVDLTARYFAIKFGTENNGEYFKVLGYTLFYQTRSSE